MSENAKLPLTCPKGHALRLAHFGGFQLGNASNIVCIAGAQCYSEDVSGGEDLQEEFWRDPWDAGVYGSGPQPRPGSINSHEVYKCWMCRQVFMDESKALAHDEAHEEYGPGQVMAYTGLKDLRGYPPF